MGHFTSQKDRHSGGALQRCYEFPSFLRKHRQLRVVGQRSALQLRSSPRKLEPSLGDFLLVFSRVDPTSQRLDDDLREPAVAAPFHAVLLCFRSDDNIGTSMVLDSEGSLARSTTVQCPNAPQSSSTSSRTHYAAIHSRVGLHANVSYNHVSEKLGVLIHRTTGSHNMDINEYQYQVESDPLEPRWSPIWTMTGHLREPERHERSKRTGCRATAKKAETPRKTESADRAVKQTSACSASPSSQVERPRWRNWRSQELMPERAVFFFSLGRTGSSAVRSHVEWLVNRYHGGWIRAS